jgi:hypothetical protein
VKVLILFFSISALLFTETALCSDKSVKTREFMPSGLTFTPITGNPQEGRMAIRKLLRGPDLHVEIGNTIDLIRWTYSQNDTSKLKRTISIGASFFSYGYITSVKENRLKVDALDGFFGGHIVYTSNIKNNPWHLRLRLMHQSAHMVDGRFDKDTETWVDGKLPISYTKDQAELTTMHYFGKSRLGAGAAIVWLRRPDEVSPYHVFLTADRLFHSSRNGIMHWYGGYFLRGEDSSSFTLSHSLTAGVKFGEWNGKGIRLIFQYFNGLNFFGEYFDERLKYASIGFSFDFW